MSQENVEVVRGGYSLFGDPGAFRRGEQVYRDTASSYRGFGGTHRWQRLMEQVLVAPGTAKRSGAPVEISVAHVFTLELSE